MTECKTNSELSEAQRFDQGVRKILSVSHKELEKREEAWQAQRANKVKPGPKPKSKS
jgi:hypothetical protein